jgi:hypothetical protein
MSNEHREWERRVAKMIRISYRGTCDKLQVTEVVAKLSPLNSNLQPSATEGSA